MSRVAEAVARTGRTTLRASRRRNYPVSVHLTLFAIGTLLPVLLIVTLGLIDAVRSRRNDSLHDANTVVRHIDATIEVEIQKAIAVGQTLATSRALIAGQYAVFDGQARDVANLLGMVIVSRDRSGQQLTSTAVPIGGTLPVSNENVLAADRETAASGKPFVSDLLIGTVLKAPIVIVDVPVTRGTETVAFIDVVLRPERLAQILSLDLPDGWIAGVVGRDGRLIARSYDQARYIGTVNRPFLDVATGPEGVWEGNTREGEAIAGAYIRSPLSGWVVSVAVPEAILRAPVRWAMTWLGGLAAASVGLSLCFGWWLSRRISSPIRDLVSSARELGDGRRPAATHSSVMEVNEVTDALLAASNELDRRAAAEKGAAAEVRERLSEIEALYDNAPVGLTVLDRDRRFLRMNPALAEMNGLPAAGNTGRFAWDVVPALKDALEPKIAEVLATGRTVEVEVSGETPSAPGMIRNWLDRIYPIRQPDQSVIAAGIVMEEITERKRSEAHLRFLMRELSHRSKNLLTVIQAMANQTAKSAESVNDFKRRFGERLMGLAASHDLLVNQNWLGVSVGNLVRGQLAAFIEANDPRTRIIGPDVDLKSEAAEALGLALHELATNSLKYGALSDQAGRVEISWEVFEPAESSGTEERDGGRRFRMDWIEHTVIPVSPPGHKGFGRMVIEHTVQATFRGSVTLAFPPEGLRWRIDAPATCLASSGRGAAGGG